MRGTLLVGIGYAVHQYADVPPHEPRKTLGRDRALHLEQLLQALALHGVGDVVRVLGRAGALLGRVGEAAEPVELRLLEKGQQLPEIVVRFAGKAHQTGRADREVRNRPPQPAELVPQRARSEEHTSELQSPDHLVCRLLLEKKKNTTITHTY